MKEVPTRFQKLKKHISVPWLLYSKQREEKTIWTNNKVFCLELSLKLTLKWAGPRTKLWLRGTGTRRSSLPTLLEATRRLELMGSATAAQQNDFKLHHHPAPECTLVTCRVTYWWSLTQRYWNPMAFNLSSRIFTLPSPQDSLKQKNKLSAVNKQKEEKRTREKKRLTPS